MFVEVVTPEKKVFEGEAEYAGFPGSDGSFGVLNNHAPLISSLNKGEIIIRTADGDKTFHVNGGFVEVLNNKVIVLAESISEN